MMFLLSLNTESFAESTGSIDESFDQDYSAESSSFIKGPLSVEARGSATAVTDGFVDATASSDETSSASFISPSAGIFTFAGNSSSSVYTNDSFAETAPSEYGGYAFSVSYPEILTINYSLANRFPYEVFLNLYDPTNNKTSYQFDDMSGTLSYKLNSGEYGFEFYDSNDYSNIDGDISMGSKATNHDDTFSFSISSAPEPSAWALMIAGVSVAGFALRRRRDRATAAIA